MPDGLRSIQVRGAGRGSAPGDLQAAYDPASGWLGLLLLDGLILREVTVLGRSSSELLGSGDVLCPWEDQPEERLLPARVTFDVLSTARIAVLDDAFAERIRPWPAIVSALLERVERRAESQAMAAALGSYPRVEVRLVALLWKLAQRWGSVVADETVWLPFRLRHWALAKLVGCERQAVTTALTALRRDGLVTPEAAGWILHGTLPLQLAFLTAPCEDDGRERRRFTVVAGGAGASSGRGFRNTSSG